MPAKNVFRLIFVIAIAMTTFLFPTKLNLVWAEIGEACCPKLEGPYQYIYDTASGECCMSGPHGTVCRADIIQCNLDNEICIENVCVLKEGAEPPSGANCGYENQPCCVNEIAGPVPCAAGYNATKPTRDPDCTCVTDQGPQITLLKPECCDLRNGEIRGESFCKEESMKEYWGTYAAVGCFPTNPSKIIEWILRYSIMFAGGVGFLIMLFASFTIMTASGDPEKLKNGQQMLGSAIAGILLVAFALFLLRFIGVTVFQLPGWGD